MIPNFSNQSIVHKCAIFIAIALGYFIVGVYSIQFASINNNISPVWFASGLAIGPIILFGPWSIPAIFLGAFFTNLTVDTPSSALIFISIGNTLEAIVGGQIVIWFLEKNYLKNYSEFFAVLAAAIVPTTISATIGTLTLYFEGISLGHDFLYAWYTWWSGDAIGILIILPIFLELYLSRDTERRSTPARLLYGLIVSAVLLSITYLVFIKGLNQAFSWLICPLLAVVGVTLGSIIARFTLIIISILIVSLTSNGYGPFEYGNLNQNLIYVQCLLYSYSFAVLFIRPFTTNFKLGPKFTLWNFISWSCLFLLIFVASNNQKETMLKELNRSVGMTLEALNKTGQQYEILLNSAEALVAVKPNLTFNEWNEFAHTINLQSYFGAINGLGYVRPVKKIHIENFVKKIQQSGIPRFRILEIDPSYASQFDDRFVTSFLAPQTANQEAFGLDVGSEKKRREAAWKAKRLRETVATEPIELVQDQFKRPGFAILHPMWSEENEFVGWISAPVVSSSFFSKSLDQFAHLLKIKVFVNDDLVYNNYQKNDEKKTNNSYLVKKDVSIFGLKHRFEFYPREKFFKQNSAQLAMLTLIMSVFLLFLSAFILEQITFGQKAEALVNERTKELEQSKMQLIHSSKMASLGEMASGMAHEINNPLTIILGKISVISFMLEELQISHPTLFEEIHKIKSTTDRIGKIVKGLRTFSRGSNSDPFEYVPLEKIISETLDLCGERLKANGVNIKIDVIPEVSVRCRPGQISQVLLNLFNNSNDAIELLAEKWIHISFLIKAPDKILISFTDSGQGIPPEIAERIMEPFYTTKEVRKGTGLGLSIVKGIIDSHGGNFWLDADSPQTRFVIELTIKELA